MKLLSLVIFVMLPAFAFGHGSKVELVEQATIVALEKFESEEPDVTVDAFNAVKTWVSGAKIKVKAYYNSNADKISYACEMKHGGEEEEMVCEKQ